MMETIGLNGHKRNKNNIDIGSSLRLNLKQNTNERTRTEVTNL